MTESLSTSNHVPDDEFDLEFNDTVNITTTLERLKEFSYYLVENVELNLNLCLRLLEEREAPSNPNSIYTTAFSKLLSTVPKVGSALSSAVTKGEIIIFDKIDKTNSRALADLVYYFSDHEGEIRNILIESSVDIFFSFEHQFTMLSCNGGPKRAMQKLAKDASDRIFNYFLETEQNKSATRTEITKGVLFGDSKRNKAGLKQGKTVVKDDTKWKTCKLYRKTGIVIVEEQTFFKNSNCKTEKYGHRRLLPWENPEDIKGTWESETGFQVPNYMLTVKEDILKTVRDYIMTKNPFENAKLERENYNNEATEDRNLKHKEVLATFREHFRELLEELEQQYKIIAHNHCESKHLVVEISKNQGEEGVFHQEISTKLEEIKKDINDTKVLIERSETMRSRASVVQVESSDSMLTVEEVKEIVKEETSRDLQTQIVDLVKEKLAKNDPGPKIKREINRSLKKLKW
uniref:Uncharacterized protein n=1 Tax=Anoplophora glabripennis TaxID=217634 RepID=V5IA67_ANOGL